MQQQVKIAITREQSFSLQTHESKSKRTWLEAYKLLVFVALQPLSRIHTHSQLYRIPRVVAP